MKRTTPPPSPPCPKSAGRATACTAATAPPCPQGIDVASVTKFLNLARAQGQVPETVREHYALLPRHAGECVACGACEKRCPFSVSIIENMKQAAELFGK